MTREEEILKYEDQLAEAERSKILMESDVFQSWLDDQLADAKDRAVRAVENHLSNYEKAMAAGILRYWRAKRKNMEREATKEYRQARIKKLEELNAEGNKRSEPSGFIAASGTF